NDVSARDWVAEALGAADPQEVRAAWGRNLLGKQFPTFCPLGPVVLTADEVSDPARLRLTTTLNGGVVQEASLSDLIVGINELVAYLSRFFALAPGDVISTGSPPGVGVARTPPVFLGPGDLVEVAVHEIGVLANPVAGCRG
ncbi:MAG TPA: fumarylacetoacetate hydrolase family protein, partial [Acidimicrobiales bacterium]|nr:fumarylacetoacetate hydrolase family protein [Acidimicrobiales bacterium]